MKMSTIGMALASCMLVGMETAAAQQAEVVGPHGGLVREAGPIKVEVAFDSEGVHVFAIGADQRPVELKESEGTIQLTFQEGGREPVSIELKPSRERAPKHLQGRAELAGVAEGSATGTVRLTRVPGVEGEVSIEVPFRLARLVEHACPMNCVPPQAEAGKCAKCKMDLVAAPSSTPVRCTPRSPRVTRGRSARSARWRSRSAPKVRPGRAGTVTATAVTAATTTENQGHREQGPPAPGVHARPRRRVMNLGGLRLRGRGETREPDPARSRSSDAAHDPGLACCGGQATAGPRAPATVLDPVCGMTIDPADAAGTHEHQGTTYAFCSAHCLAAFKAHPERYAGPEARAHEGHGATEAKDAPGTTVDYTCPMHPEIVRSEPGPCPICGMALEPRTVSGVEDDG